MRSVTPLAVALCALLAGGATAARDFARQAEAARQQDLPAVSIDVDATWGNRTNGAAKALTEAHGAFGRVGDELVDVETSTENGDLQGFFASYRKGTALPVEARS